MKIEKLGAGKFTEVEYKLTENGAWAFTFGFHRPSLMSNQIYITLSRPEQAKMSLGVYRVVKKFLRDYGDNQLLCRINPKDPVAVRFVKALGFSYAGPSVNSDLYTRG